MGYQFVHLESFSRKGDDKGRSTSFIFAEARRDPVASFHVANPAPPVVVFGVGLAEVEALHDAAADAARTVPKTGTPRKLRRDHKTLHTVIASHPYAMDEVSADPAKRAEVEEWEARTIRWLRSQYGDDLKSVVRHEDESHYHIHAYVVPTDDPEMRALRHHPGVVAKRETMAAGPKDGENSKALSKRADREYKAMMRAWQDAYHATVGVPCGLARLGPRRRNLPRGEWQRETAQARALQAALDRASVVEGKVEFYVAAKKNEAESVVSMAMAEADRLRAEAEAAKAEAARHFAESKATTEAAKAAHDAAVREQRKAMSMMRRVREEATRVRAASARLQRLPILLRMVFDGFRKSRVADRVRAAVAVEIEQLHDRATSADRRADVFERRAIAAETVSRKAEGRIRALDTALTETAAQRDAARREVQRLRRLEAKPSLGAGFGPRPTPGR